MPAPDFRRIAEQHQDEIVALARALVRIDTTNTGVMPTGNETAAAQTMDKIRVYENQYAAKNRGKFATFDQLIQNVGLDERFAGDHPVVNGYTYTLIITESSGSQPAKFAVSADPQGEGIAATGNRHFYTDSTLSTIKFSDTAPASAADPSI